MLSKFPKIETLQNFQVVFWDLDNTIYEYESAHKIALKAALQQFSKIFNSDIEKGKEQYSVARKEINIRLHGQASSHNRLLYFKEMIQNIGSTKIAKALVLEKTYWDTFLKNMEISVEAFTLIKLLYKKGIPQAIITDLTTQIQLQKIKQLKLEKYFQLILTSEEAGIEKPNAQIFEMALAKMNVNAANCCMIGDNIKTDSGAENVGIKTFIV